MEHLREETQDAVQIVVIDRPPVNALDYEAVDELRALFAAVGDREDVRAVVLTGAGTRAFSAGLDLTATRDRSRIANRTDPGRRARHMLEAIRVCPIPVVAAVNGPAIGGGMSVVAMCDCIVMSNEAWIQAPEINVGLLGAFNHLVSLVGPRRARHLYLSGARCSAEELYQMGTAVAVCDTGELLDEAVRIARELAAKDPIAVRLAKEAMLRTEGLTQSAAYRLEQDYTFRLQAIIADAAPAPVNTEEQ